MDQDAINLAKAIRQAETGNRPVAGKSGELPSRYQFLPSTWKSWSKQYLGIDNAPITLENENKVAYSKIKELKDKGLNPAQIASVWNSGSPKWEGKVGVNKMGVKYDVPLYVNRVYSEYQKVKGGQQATGTSLRSQYQQAQEPQVQTIEQQRADLQSQGMPVAKDPTRVNPTMGGMIARDILKTPAKMLENVRAIPKILQGQSFEQATAPRESKYFGGTIAPFRASAFGQLPYTLRRQQAPESTQGNFGRELKESIGAGAELASYLPFGKVVTGTATALKTGSKVFGKEALKLAGRRIGANAVEGLVGTAMFEGGKRLQGEKDRGSFGGALAYGTGGAVALGVLGSGLSRGVRQGRRTLASLGGKISEDIAQESTQRLKGAWTGVVDNYKDLRTFRNKQAKYGRNIEDILTEEVMVPEIVEGKIDTQKLLPEVDNRIKAQSIQLAEYAKKFDHLPVKIDEVQKIAEGVIRDTPSLTATGEYKTALGELERRMAGLKDIYGETIVPSQLNVIRAEMNKITKAFGGDVFKQDVADAIADAVREKLDDVIQDDVFRRGNAKVGDLINIRKFLQKVDGKQVGGGRFSQAFAGIVGSIVGSEAKQAGLPVLGPVLGYLGGREISKQARQFAFGSAGPRTRAILRRMQRKNAIGQEIAEKSAKVEQKLLPARTSPVNKAYSTGKTIELPRRTASTVEKAERENLVLEKLKKGDEIKVGGEALEVTLKTSDGVVVKMEDGTKKFLKTSELANAKDMKDQNLYDGAMSEVESSMEVSQAGYRIFNDTGVGTEVRGVASTFPKWISEELRSKKLFDRVISKIRNNEALTSPSERKLYKEMTDEAVRRYNNVKDQAGKKQIFDASEFGGDQAFGAVAGIQMDEDGNLTFDKKSAIAGVAGMAVAKKAGVLKNVKKATGDLIEEAKKYKSAEEFVKAQGKPLLHGGLETINEFKYAGKRGAGGVYLTPDNTMAKTFSGKEGQITEAFVKPKKVFKIQKGSDTLAGSGGMGDDILVEAPHNYPDEIKRLKAEGYDAIRSSDGKQLLILDPSQIKTKSQLTDIWNKANKSVTPPKAKALTTKLENSIDLKTKRPIVVSDVVGFKVTIPQDTVIQAGSGKGSNMIIDIGGTRHTINKNQFQNLKGQSLVAEAREFAPELKGTEETVLGDIDPEKTFGIPRAMKEFDAGKEIYGIDDEGIESLIENREDIKNFSNFAFDEDFTPDTLPTKYSNYTLPDGKNYKEVIIKAPVPKGDVLKIDWVKDPNGDLNAKVYGKDLTITPEGSKFYVYEKGGRLGQSLNTLEEAQKVAFDYANKNTPKAPTFKSSHWDEPNVISHIRLNERTYQGKKVTFMEELQSDWAREGRSKGFIKDVAEQNKEFNAYDKSLWEKYAPTLEKKLGHSRRELSELLKVITPEEKLKWDSLQKGSLTSDIPNNPLLKNWQELSIKRALKDAVDNDSKYFAWINGEQTSARYNLSTVIDKSEWKPFNNGKYITLTKKDGGTMQFVVDEKGIIDSKIKHHSTPDSFAGKKLDEVLGKGLADKIMEKESGTLAGDGLSFGGEWASNLYDKQVKNIVEDLTGQKAEMLDMGLAVDKKNTVFRNKPYPEDPLALVDAVAITNKDIKVGNTIYQIKKPYIITDVLGDGKFKAVPKENYDKFVGNGGFKMEDINKSHLTETFDISQKTTTQQAIKITPEVKAIVRGEAPRFTSSKKPIPVEAFAGVPLIFNLFGEKVVSEDEETITTKSGLFGNKTKVTRKDILENAGLPKSVSIGMPTDENLGKILMDLESSGGKNRKNADEGEKKWLVGLTETAITELKRLKRISPDFDKNNKEDVIDAGIKYFKLMMERNPKMTPAQIYVNKYWTQGKTEADRQKKMKEFEKMVENFLVKI